MQQISITNLVQNTMAHSGSNAARLAALTVARLLDGPASMQPHRRAIIDAAGDLTFYALRRAVEGFALRLSQARSGIGDRVAVFTGKDNATVVALLGVLRAGASYVPIDRSAPVERQ